MILENHIIIKFMKLTVIQNNYIIHIHNLPVVPIMYFRAFFLIDLSLTIIITSCPHSLIKKITIQWLGTITRRLKIGQLGSLQTFDSKTIFSVLYVSSLDILYFNGSLQVFV